MIFLSDYWYFLKVALRWRIEAEVVSGRGQFSCGNKACGNSEQLRTWEVNFAYSERGEKKNALVKVRKYSANYITRNFKYLIENILF
jgi:protein FRA10AC1